MPDPTDRPWKRARKRPVWIEYREAGHGEVINTREGTLMAQPGDLIIRGVEGEMYPIGREIFEKTYETEMDGADLSNADTTATVRESGGEG